MFPAPTLTALLPIAMRDPLLFTAVIAMTTQEEGRRMRKDGSLFWASVVVTAVRDREGALEVVAPCDVHTAGSRGLQRVATLVEQLRGELQVDRRSGAAFQIRFSGGC